MTRSTLLVIASLVLLVLSGVRPYDRGLLMYRVGVAHAQDRHPQQCIDQSQTRWLFDHVEVVRNRVRFACHCP